MEKVVRIVKKGEDDSNLLYWLQLSFQERLAHLEILRNEINPKQYEVGSKLQRVYTIVEKEGKE